MNDLLIYGTGGAIITIACQILMFEANDEKPISWRPFIIGSALGVSVLVKVLYLGLSLSGWSIFMSIHYLQISSDVV